MGVSSSELETKATNFDSFDVRSLVFSSLVGREKFENENRFYLNNFILRGGLNRGKIHGSNFLFRVDEVKVVQLLQVQKCLK